MRKISMMVALVFLAALGFGQKYSAGKTPTNDKSRIALDKIRKGTKPNQVLMTLGDTVLRYVDSDTAAVIARPYKVYTALLTQTGTSAPTAVVLENTLGGVPVWTRTGAGIYRCTLAGAFTDLKTIAFVTETSSANGTRLTNYVVPPDMVVFSTIDFLDYISEDWYISIEIRVYN